MIRDLVDKSLAAIDQTRTHAPPTTSSIVPSKSILSVEGHSSICELLTSNYKENIWYGQWTNNVRELVVTSLSHCITASLLEVGRDFTKFHLSGSKSGFLSTGDLSMERKVPILRDSLVPTPRPAFSWGGGGSTLGGVG